MVSRRLEARVRLLGHEGDLRWRIDEAARLVIEVPELAPAQRPCEHAYSFVLTGFETSLGSAAPAAAGDAPAPKSAP